MRVLFLSGAGLSAESGVPTFRDQGGLYRQEAASGLSPERLLSAWGYQRQRERVEAFVEALRQQVERAEPNAAHRAYAAYEARYPEEVLHFTQNVDSLLERAGSRNVRHLFGELGGVRCLGHRHRFPRGEGRGPGERCPRCGSGLRSDVVLFEETAPELGRLKREVRRLRSTDALVVTGTYGSVLDLAGLVRHSRAFRVLNLLEPSPHIPESLFEWVLHEPATEALPRILDVLEERRTLNERRREM